MSVQVGEFVQFQLDLQDKIRSACLTLQKLPNEEAKYLRAGERCCWPPFIQDWQAYGSAGARPPRIPPSPGAIDNMHDVIGWMAWLAVQDRDEAKIVWLCFGMGHKSKSAARAMGVSRDTIQRKRKAGLERMAHHILGISKKAA